LTEEQKAVYESCRFLAIQGNDAAWEPVVSPSIFVSMWMKYSPSTDGGRSIAWSLAEAEVNCSVHDALSYYGHACSRTYTRTSLEEGNPALIQIKRRSDHDYSFATIKAMPYPFHYREFVVRSICTREVNDGSDAAASILVFAPEPENEPVDYGSTFRVVRGLSRVYMQILPVAGHEQDKCLVKYHQLLDAGGFIPAWLVNSKIAVALQGVVDLQEKFQRNDEDDEEMRVELENLIKQEPQVYSAEEDASLSRVRGKLECIPELAFKPLESPDQFVKMSACFVPGNPSLVARATTVIDAPIESCAALEICVMSKALRKAHFESGGLDRILKKRNDHSAIFQVVYDLNAPGVSPREFCSSQLWTKEGDGTIILTYESVDLPDEFPIDRASVRASMMAFWKFENLQKIGGVDQTLVTWIQQVDLKGAIPSAVINSSAISNLMHLSSTREIFDQSVKIDAANRARNVEMIQNHADDYTDEEIQVLEAEEAQFVLFENQHARSLQMSSHLTSARVAFKKGDSLGWGWASTVVKASAEEVLGTIWDTLKRSSARKDDIVKSVDEKPNGHNQLIYIVKSMKAPITDRDFLTRAVWKRTGFGFVYALKDEENENRPLQPGIVRAKLPSIMKLVRISLSRTKVEYMIHPDAGGKVPAYVMNLQLKKNLNRVTEIREMFECLRRLEQWDDEDARDVGDVLMISYKFDKYHKKKGETNVSARLRVLFSKYAGLREIGANYGFFEGMMVEIVRNRLRPARDVSRKLCNLRANEGATIGSGLAISLASNLTSEAAVEEWIVKYPALRELDRSELWFRPMMNTVALRLLGEVSWGLKLRVAMGAGLSMLDLVSDISVIILYRSSDEQLGYATSLTWMIAACLALQLVLIFFQHRARGKWTVLKQAVIVLAGLKPGKCAVMLNAFARVKSS
jgi:hypothetical protein